MLAVIDKCDSEITVNNTHIVNPNWPGTYSSSGVCEYTIKKPSSGNICFFRLNLDQLWLVPETDNEKDDGIEIGENGRCLTDSIKTDCDHGTSVPKHICGKNSGQHSEYPNMI